MVSRFERLMGCASIPLGQSPPEDDNTQCSGRGDCLNGTCLCEIRYSGDECSGFNLPYHAGKNPSVIFPSNFPNKKKSPIRRHFVRVLLCRVHLAGPADDLHHRRVPAAQAAQLSAGLPAHHAEAALLFRLYRVGAARGVLYHTGKDRPLPLWGGSTKFWFMFSLFVFRKHSNRRGFLILCRRTIRS